MSEAKITVTKLDAARRQLRAAIRLWFTNGDPVAIHTLASAAHEIIHTLFRRKGLRGLMFDSTLIKEEYRGDWAKLIKRKATFFKHAQRDPDSEIEFDPEENWGLILAGAHGMRRMGEPAGLEELAFAYWFWIYHPDWFFNVISSDRIPVDAVENFRTIKKHDFFQAFELLWQQGNPNIRPIG